MAILLGIRSRLITAAFWKCLGFAALLHTAASIAREPTNDVEYTFQLTKGDPVPAVDEIQIYVSRTSQKRTAGCRVSDVLNKPRLFVTTDHEVIDRFVGEIRSSFESHNQQTYPKNQFRNRGST
jgi:hypothetical protein